MAYRLVRYLVYNRGVGTREILLEVTEYQALRSKG